jgi:anaerobic selenocysteine-containing dehydrogenase
MKIIENPSLETTPTSKVKVVRAVCPHDCPDTCAMLVTVENGIATKVQGNPDHPPTHGALCNKVSRYIERTYHPDRLTVPMRRIGKKGEGRFEPITWPQAISEISAKLISIASKRPEAILPYSYAGTMGYVQGEGMAQRFFHKLGASQLDRTICSSAGGTALAHTLGAKVGMDVENFVDSKLIIIWGSNSITSNLHFWTFAQEAKRRGAKLIAIDPYKSDTALKCHEHIALLPGTDSALALGIAQQIIVNNWLDADYVQKHTLGFDGHDGLEGFANRVSTYTPEVVADICGISADVIRKLAYDYAHTPPAAIRLNYGLQRTHGGGNAVRAIVSLPALIGAWRLPAGGALLSASGHHPETADRLIRPDLVATFPVMPRVINMSSIGDALLSADPAIEAVVVYNSNPLAVAPDSSKVKEGFAREDLFTVVLEHFQTDTADYADYLLPATTQLEHFDLHKTYGHRYLMLNTPAIAPVGESKPNSEIFRLLASACGFTDKALTASDEQIAADAMQWDDPRLEGTSLAQLKAEGWAKLKIADAPFANGNFPTVSGKCEFFSQNLKNLGQDPLPSFVAPYESPRSAPALAKQYPLMMISPPARNFMNSTFVNVASLAKSEKHPKVEIHPADASARGITQGAMVRMFNGRGSILLIANISDRIRQGVVVGWGIWWHKLSPEFKSINTLTGQQLTDMGRGPTFYDCLVEVATA